MAVGLSIIPLPAPHAALPQQLILCCRSCGAPQLLARGLCPPCYAARRHDQLRFGGCRAKVLERDRGACRVCGNCSGQVHVHHRRPGVSREKLLIALCPSHHALVHKLRVLDRPLPPLLAELWREQHPGAPEQLRLDFGPEPSGVASSPRSWKRSLAG